MTNKMQLPEPDFLCRHEDSTGTEVGPPTKYFSDSTVRRLISEAVTADREACAALCESLPVTYPRGQQAAWECAAAIRARTSAPKTAEQACIQGLRNVIAEDTQP